MALDDPLLDALGCGRMQAKVPPLFDLHGAPLAQLIAAFEWCPRFQGRAPPILVAGLSR